MARTGLAAGCSLLFACRSPASTTTSGRDGSFAPGLCEHTRRDHGDAHEWLDVDILSGRAAERWHVVRRDLEGRGSTIDPDGTMALSGPDWADLVERLEHFGVWSRPDDDGQVVVDGGLFVIDVKVGRDFRRLCGTESEAYGDLRHYLDRLAAQIRGSRPRAEGRSVPWRDVDTVAIECPAGPSEARVNDRCRSALGDRATIVHTFAEDGSFTKTAFDQDDRFAWRWSFGATMWVRQEAPDCDDDAWRFVSCTDPRERLAR
jgi:hypothetical protein